MQGKNHKAYILYAMFTAVLLLFAVPSGMAYAEEGEIPPAPVPVSGISLDKDSLLLCPGDTAALTAAVMPEDAAEKGVQWVSENPEIVSVEGGVVTAIELGTVIVKAVTLDGGFEAACTVTVKAGKISSPVYLIGGGLINGVAKYTGIETFLSNLHNATDIHIYNADGSEFTSGRICTGMTAALIISGVERDRLTIIVNGDSNGDGGLTIIDYTQARLDILGLRTLEGCFRTAADINADGSISILDYTLMRLDILNLKPISGAQPILPEVSDPRIRAFLDIALAQQGKPYIWSTEGPDSFDCSGFVYYCHTQSGYPLGRSTADTYSRKDIWLYVNKNELQPGDLMFFNSDDQNDGDHIGHIGICLGNGYFIHASSDYGYIVICRIEGWYDSMLSHGRRVFY